MRQTWMWGTIAGIGLYFTVFLLLRAFTGLRPAIIHGFEFAAISTYFIVRALTWPFAEHRALQKGQLLLAILPALMCASFLLSAWPATSPYAFWILLAGIILFFVSVRPRIRNLRASLHQRNGPPKKHE
jgi:hypothetical protein